MKKDDIICQIETAYIIIRKKFY